MIEHEMNVAYRLKRDKSCRYVIESSVYFNFLKFRKRISYKEIELDNRLPIDIQLINKEV